MTFFDGLYFYEIVLLALGAALFVALVVSLVFLVTKRRPFGKLFAFFSIPIVMIGYPGIQSIQFSSGVVTIEKYTKELERNPANKTLRARLATQVSGLATRPSSNPATIATVARAQIALGNKKQAQATLQKALRLAPDNPQVVSVQRMLKKR